MEIIKPRTDKQMQVTCRKCGAVIGYYKTEVKYWICRPQVSRIGRHLPGVGFEHIDCPSCGAVINLELIKNEDGNKE